MRKLLFLTLPACLATGVLAARAVRDAGGRVAEDIVATFTVDSVNAIDLPAAGAYRAVGVGSVAAGRAVDTWEITLRPADGEGSALVERATALRAQERKNQPGLDLLFVLRVPAPGRYAMRVSGRQADHGPVTLRISRVNRETAGRAMRAFGLATVFSVLLLASAVLYFRR